MPAHQKILDQNNFAVKEAYREDLDFMLKEMPINVLVCDAKDYIITYANRMSTETLNSITDVLPEEINGNTIIGQSIDVFHKHPEHQRNILRHTNKKGHNSVIRLGHHFLDLKIIPITKQFGEHSAYMLTWSVITDMERLRRMSDIMPINIIMCDPTTLKITYINKTSIDTLRPLQKFLPVSVDDLLGTCIDVFHKKPEHQRRILADPKNLPFKSTIRLGEHHMSLDVSAIVDDTGYYIGAMVSWALITKQVEVANSTRDIADSVAVASTELSQTSSSMSSTINNVSIKANEASLGANETTKNVESVAIAAEQMSAAIQEIAQQMSASIASVEESVASVGQANQSAGELSDASNAIGDILRLIHDIAEQINLLALNATIEAARAGDAGRSFAVVASEIKTLASHTERATKEISHHITNVQGSSKKVLKALSQIKEAVESVNDNSMAISSAVEEQSAVTHDIAQNMQVAASGVERVSSALKDIGAMAHDAGGASKEVNNAADSLSQQSNMLNHQMNLLLENRDR
ncbi:MAG: methyl-accepting chemotaxis protein [Pseudomonadota bacterium]